MSPRQSSSRRDRLAPPQVLFDEVHWYACHTYGRHEKRVAELLTRFGFQTYLPLRAEERQWSDRQKIVEFPAFPGYVFARFKLSQLSRVLATPGIAGLVETRGYPAPIADREINQVRRTLEVTGADGLEVGVDALPDDGHRVRVVSGLFIGIEGHVVQMRGRTKVLVGVSPLRRALAVEVPLRDVRRID